MFSFSRRKLKRLYRSIFFPFRRATAGFRVLPDFIVIGVQKGGSSSLYNYIGQHPQVVRAEKKEIEFFCGGYNPEVDKYSFGVDWYRAHFPLRLQLPQGKITGEATPLYISSPFAAERIYETLPEVKLLAILRNPVERAISQYFHMKRKNKEPLELFDALEQEEARVRSSIEGKRFRDHAFVNWTYQDRGLYAKQLQPFFQKFPKENIKIICSEHLFKQTDAVMKDVFNYLNIDTQYRVGRQIPVNRGNNKTEVPKKVYEKLYEFFKNPNEELFELIGERFPWEPK